MEAVDGEEEFGFKDVGQIPFDCLVQLHLGQAQRFERRRQRRVALHRHVTVERPLQVGDQLHLLFLVSPLKNNNNNNNNNNNKNNKLVDS